MKSTFKILMMVAAFLGSFAAASFALDGMEVHARIPFSFIAGSKTFPAGTYTFQVDDPGQPVMLDIQQAGGAHHESLLTETLGLPKNEPAPVSKLVFDRYGSEHYLAEVWVAGMDEARAIRMSDIERERLGRLEHERVSVPLSK